MMLDRPTSRQFRPLFRAVAVVLFPAAFASCVSRGRSSAGAPPLDLPPAFTQPSGERALADRWWEEVGDPALNDWIAAAFEGGFDLARAQARLEQAEAVAAAAGADRWPQLNLEAGARRSRTTVAVGPTAGRTDWTNNFSLGLAASYELDLWGRVGATARAARRETEASREDLATARLTLAAEITDLWLQAREQAEQRALLETQRQAGRDYLELTERRFAEGQTTALDVLQQRQQLAALEALVPSVEARYAVLRHQLAALAGRVPGDAPSPSAGVPALPPLPAAGVPADLLTRRPDVRAAMLRLAAADERVAAAVAARLPALRFSANAGYQAGEVSALFDEWIASLIGNLTLPLLDGGRRAAEVRRSRAAARDLALAAAQTLLRAVREVEDALVQEVRQRETVERLETQSRVAAETLALARERYAGGLTDYLTVLTALDRLQSVERSLVTARRQAWAHRIQLYRALGGTPADAASEGPRK